MNCHSKTILIADDNPENLGVLSKILEEAGYKVRTALNGQLALNSIQAATPDMALIDLHMPVMDGYELCKQIKNDTRYAHIPVLFVSAISESFNKVIAFDLGAVDYISKPVDPQEVLSRVGAHLKIQHLQQELEKKNHELESLVEARTADLNSALEKLKILHGQLSSLDDAKNNFLQLISHELRTPLVGLGIVDELLDKELSEEESKLFQNIFWASHQKIINIVDHAGTLTQLNLTKPNYHYESLKVKQLAYNASKELQALMSTKNVTLDVQGDDQQIVVCDPDYGKMVINALLETAIKFTSEGNVVKVTWTEQEEDSTIFIQANGWMLPEKHIPDFFETLKIHEAIFPGGDLGLAPAVAKQVMNACGGSIEVSNRDSEGITLAVSFLNHNGDQ